MIQFKVGDVVWAKSAPETVYWQVANLEGDENITVTFKYFQICKHLQNNSDYTWQYIYKREEGVPPGWGIIRDGEVIQFRDGTVTQ